MGTNRRVLIVDDEHFIRALLCRTLDDTYVCVTASGLEEARQRLEEEEPFDLLLSDIDMPDGSGLDLAATVLNEGGETAVILMTGVSDEKLAADAVRIGVHGYLLKPFKLDEVRIRISEAVSRAGIGDS